MPVTNGRSKEYRCPCHIHGPWMAILETTPSSAEAFFDPCSDHRRRDRATGASTCYRSDRCVATGPSNGGQGTGDTDPEHEQSISRAPFTCRVRAPELQSQLLGFLGLLGSLLFCGTPLAPETRAFPEVESEENTTPLPAPPWTRVVLKDIHSLSPGDPFSNRTEPVMVFDTETCRCHVRVRVRTGSVRFENGSL